MSRLAQVSPYVISRQTPTAVATCDIVIPSTTSTPTGPGYRAIEIFGWMLPATDNVAAWIRLSNDGGATYRAGASDYAWTESFLQITGGSASGTTTDAADATWAFGAAIGNVAAEGISFRTTIVAPLNAARKTIMATDTVVKDTSGNTFRSIVRGELIIAAEINNAIRFMFSSGNIASGEISAYGHY